MSTVTADDATAADVGSRRRDRDTDRVVVITSDAHAGPLLEQMRQYCPADRIDEFERYVDAHEHTLRGVGVGGRDPSPDDIRTTTMRNVLTDGGWDMAARLDDMDRDGIAGEIIFHGLNAGRVEPIPFSVETGFHVGATSGDVELVALGRHMYNQWLADFVSLEPERHAGLAQLPMWDVDAAIAELEWARDAGLRGVNFPRLQPGITPYSHPDWEPFWSACEALDMPLSTHAQSGGPVDGPGTGEGAVQIGILEVTGYAVRTSIYHLVFGKVFERHPGLKIVFTEQPGLWWRPMVEEMDSLQILQRDLVAAHLPVGRGAAGESERLPSAYAREHMFVGATCLAPFEAQDACEQGYATQVLWGSDYPHPEGSWQFPRDEHDDSMTRLHLRDTFAGIPTEQTALMVGENAARVYGFDLAKLQDVAERIDAPTFADLATPLASEPEDRTTTNRGAWYCFRRHGAYH